MLGDALMVAPIFREDSAIEYYLPEGRWTHLLSGRTAHGGRWHEEHCDMDDLPIFVRENSILPIGKDESLVDYDYLDGLEIRIYQPNETGAQAVVVDQFGNKALTLSALRSESTVKVIVEGEHKGISVLLYTESGVKTNRIEPGSSILELEA